MAGLEDADSVSPEIGRWLKESEHGQGFGREVVTALVEWGHATLGKESFTYPVAIQNIASRRIAENLHGEIIGWLTFHQSSTLPDGYYYRSPVAQVVPKVCLNSGNGLTGNRAQDSQGLTTPTPIPSKSVTFLVATVRPCTRAVAAMRASRSERGFGT